MSCPKIVESDKTPLEIAVRGDDSPGGSLTSNNPVLVAEPFDGASAGHAIPEGRTVGSNPATGALPDPWMFDSEALLRELDRIREAALQVPTNGDANATHFGLQLVINAAWTLRENIRYILALHRQGQRAVRLKQGTEAQHQTIYDLRNWVLATC